MADLNIPIDPVLSDINSKGTDIVSIQGFAAGNKRGIVSFYPSRDSKFFFEIKEKDIVAAMESETKHGPCTLLVCEDADIQIERLNPLLMKAGDLADQINVDSDCGCGSTSKTAALRAGIQPVSPEQAECRGSCFDKFLACPYSAERCNARYSACNTACQIFGLTPGLTNSFAF
ncbi:MAG: hypothetical protein QNI84_14320 [Henriciella sp.]|nr:hypothetical protein [Henriciella sp.]